MGLGLELRLSDFLLRLTFTVWFFRNLLRRRKAITQDLTPKSSQVDHRCLPFSSVFFNAPMTHWRDDSMTYFF